jgi:hypothetical protein
LRTTADLLERLSLSGLSLTIDEGVTIQVPEALGDADLRKSVCAVLAAAIGAALTRSARPGPTHGWVQATGQLAGHPVKVFTPINTAITADGSHQP